MKNNMRFIKATHRESEIGYMYRCQDERDGVKFKCLQFPIIKETDCGYWIDTSFGWGDSRRWVAKKGRNNYAKITKAAALENYYRRKCKQVKLLEERLSRAKTMRELACFELGR